MKFTKKCISEVQIFNSIYEVYMVFYVSCESVDMPDMEQSSQPRRFPSLKQAVRGQSSKREHNVHVRIKQMQYDFWFVLWELTTIWKNHMLLSVAVDIC